MSPLSGFDDPDLIPVWAIPSELVKVAISWDKSGYRVAARRDDANQWRIMKLYPGEVAWIGWREVDLGVRPA